MTDVTNNTPQITPFLWFNNNAEEAVEFYLSVFEGARRLDTVRAGKAGPWNEGSVVMIAFELGGRPYTAFNGGPHHAFNDAISLVVTCQTQDEIDRYWNALTAGGGQEVQCGWLKDKFGVSWQIVPAAIRSLIQSQGAMEALMTMKKLDIAALEAAV
jgi:predicted 3-demethylubiquinone-9 3-methyltransferase (glyoxalase superfamily)